MPSLSKSLHAIFILVGYLLTLLFWNVEILTPTLNVDDYAYSRGKLDMSLFLQSGRIFGYLENVVLSGYISPMLISIKYLVGLFIVYTSSYFALLGLYRFFNPAFGMRDISPAFTSIFAVFAGIWSSTNIYTYELLSFDSAILGYSLCFASIPLIVYYFNEGEFKSFFSIVFATFLCMGTYQTSILAAFGLIFFLYITNIFVNGVQRPSRLFVLLGGAFLGVVLNMLLIYLMNDSGYERTSLFSANSINDTLKNGLWNIFSGPWKNVFFVDGIIGWEIKFLLIFMHLSVIAGIIIFILSKDNKILVIASSMCIVWYFGWGLDAFFTPKLAYLNLRHVSPIINLEIVFFLTFALLVLARYILQFTLFIMLFIVVSSGMSLIETTKRQSFINTIDAYVATKYTEGNRKKYNKHTDDLRHICGIPGWSRNSIWRSAFHASWSYEHIFSLLKSSRLNEDNACLKKIQNR